MNMNLNQLSIFVALAEELHFGRAARRLGVSQPGVSRVLSDLEEQIDTKLLDRSSRNIVLTVGGQAFLKHAKRALESADMAIRSAKAGRPDGIDCVELGLMIGAAMPQVGDLLKRFRDRHPETRINIRRVDELSIANDLATGKIDAAIAWDASVPAGFSRKPLFTVPLSIAIPTGHELDKFDELQLGQIADYPLIMPARDRQPIIHKMNERLAKEHGFVPNIVADTATIMDLLVLVSAGVGVGNAPFPEGFAYPGVSIKRQLPRFNIDYEIIWSEKKSVVKELLAVVE